MPQYKTLLWKKIVKWDSQFLRSIVGLFLNRKINMRGHILPSEKS